ncbi:MAG: hypothetical protein D3918_03180 [Candidatus Electrothrix sp. AX2]|nr:hypothetical protein [Candidatus Electrothrix gigas]
MSRYILIADNDPKWVSRFEKLFINKGYDVLCANSIDEANEKINKYNIGLSYINILLDQENDTEDGWLFDWTNLLSNANDKKIPVTVITGMDKNYAIENDDGGKILLTDKAKEYEVYNFLYKNNIDHNRLIESTDIYIKNQVTGVKLTMKTKILLLAANPFDTKQLRLDEEIREIKINIELAKERDSLNFQSLLAVRPRDLMQEMHNECPDYVQFSGHGAENGIFLEQNNGKPHFVSNSALEALFKYFKKVQCVVLNCCYSEIQAQTIAAHIPYVIGTSFSILDKAAIIFSAGFYQAIGAGKDIPSAFNAGKVCLSLEGYEENHPTLWIDGKIAS